MKVKSMTGLGRGIMAKDSYDITVELKTVNHKFKDIRFKMPPLFSAIEMKIRKIIKEKIRRGSVDVLIIYKKSGVCEWDYIDKDKIKSFIKEIKSCVGDKVEFNGIDFLKSHFIKEQIPDEKLEECVLECFYKALDNLLAARAIEGEKLALLISEHAKNYKKKFLKLRPLAEDYKKELKKKLRKKISSLKEELPADTPRFLQEIFYYLEKMDITEELDRINGHLGRIDESLNKKGEIGRELDFILQELNRETNTIGAKSANKVISNLIIDMKLELEKMREQSLNLE